MSMLESTFRNRGSLFGRQPRKNKIPRRYGALAMERLDDRRLLAVTPIESPLAVVSGGSADKNTPVIEEAIRADDDDFIRVTTGNQRAGDIPCGNRRDDGIFIYDLNGDGDLHINCNGVESNPLDVHRIDINVGSGRDTVKYYQLDHRGHRSMDLNVDLGRGGDTFQAYIWGDIRHGRTLDIEVNGGSGRDTLAVIADETNMYVSGGSSFHVDLDGGSWSDTLWFSYRGEMDGSLYGRLRGNSGYSDVAHLHWTLLAGSTGPRFWNITAETEHIHYVQDRGANGGPLDPLDELFEAIGTNSDPVDGHTYVHSPSADLVEWHKPLQTRQRSETMDSGVTDGNRGDDRDVFGALDLLSPSDLW